MSKSEIAGTRTARRVRSVRWLLVAAGMMAAFTVLAPTAAASSHKDRTFHLAKVCGDAGCTVTSSTYRKIGVGTLITYAGDSADALVATVHAKHGTATGHCDISAVFAGTGPGTCVFARGNGTGSLKHFRITLAVTFDGTTWFWDGTFRRPHCHHRR